MENEKSIYGTRLPEMEEVLQDMEKNITLLRDRIMSEYKNSL